MYEPPKSRQLPGNPYAGIAAAHNDTTQALLALAYEIRTLIMLEHPHIEHETVTKRMKDSLE